MTEQDANGKPEIERLAAILPVRDVAEALRFYARLGFTGELYDGDAEYAFLERDGQMLHLRQLGNEEHGSGASGVYVYAADADDLYDELVAAGVSCLGEPEDKPWRMREFAASDPDGNLLRFGHRLPPR